MGIDRVATSLPALPTWSSSGLQRGRPADQLAADETLLDAVEPGGPARIRWYVVDRPALVLGFAQRLRSAQVVDRARAATAGVEVIERRAGGGLVLLDDGMLSLAVAVPLPHPLIADDITTSYRWLGERLARGLWAIGVSRARSVGVAEARADAASLRGVEGGELPRLACYGSLSPYEVVVGGAKLAGLAQVRRRHGVLFQAGLLLRNQARLADFVVARSESERAALRRHLAVRTVGLADLLDPVPDPAGLAAALERSLIADSA